MTGKATSASSGGGAAEGFKMGPKKNRRPVEFMLIVSY